MLINLSGSVLNTTTTVADVAASALVFSLNKLSDTEITSPATNALLSYDGTKWKDTTTLSPHTINIAKLYFDASQDGSMDHDVYYSTATKKVLSGNTSDRYLNLELSGLTNVAKADVLSSSWSGYAAQTRYTFKYNDTGTNDANYNLGDVRFQYNYNGSGNDNTDMAIRVFADGGSTNIKVLRIKLNNQLMMGPDGIPGGGHTPAMGYLEWKGDRFDIRNHDGRIRLDTTSGDIRVQTNSGHLECRAKSGNATLKSDVGHAYVTASSGDIRLTSTGTAELKTTDGEAKVISVNGITRLKSTNNKVVIEGTQTDIYGDKIVMKGPLKLNQLTTTERDALTGELGFMIFNTTTNKAQVFTGSGWVDLH
jgi:hypothetical protein